MPTSMQHWTPEQWTVFGLTVAAGIAAVMLAYVVRSAVRGWTAPAPMRLVAHTSTPRPTLMLAAQRMTFDPTMRTHDRIALQEIARGEHLAAWTYDHTGEARVIRDVPVLTGDSPTALPPQPVQHDPMKIDYSSHGVGALRDVLTVTVDPTLRTSAEIAAEETAWINAYADLSGLMPQTDAERERVRIAIEPAIRTARLWLVRAGEGGAGRAGLTKWRLETDTGEIRFPFPITKRSVAHALLSS